MAEQTNLRRVVTTTQSNVVVPALLALVFGLFLLLGSGFAGSETLHNAAHDSRHSFAFPCH
ncbi:MAG: CbtB domain-containing protein [Pseudomonadota bacterium]|nr:cobalt transporter subunit [Alphaproteobacteria bacterium]MEC7463178.1 CbtB domain-containing protein [Pseudomonadota bacterium]MEC7942963.1 CbtB domain-containing protein [Pseudomonadota bacterium]MEC8289197.1 CbtB domain-containing protein [Pseudomonadota bacterium]MEC8463591.1 CbtB domain-containing protein [Pseudomonadota bacterium]